MTQHSVAPWRDETGTIFAADDMAVCEVLQDFMDEDNNAECLANKRLILAAPQMLETLQTTLAAIKQREEEGDLLWTTPGETAGETLRNAIEDATGTRPE